MSTSATATAATQGRPAHTLGPARHHEEARGLSRAGPAEGVRGLRARGRGRRAQAEPRALGRALAHRAERRTARGVNHSPAAAACFLWPCMMHAALQSALSAATQAQSGCTHLLAARWEKRERERERGA